VPVEIATTNNEEIDLDDDAPRSDVMTSASTVTTTSTTVTATTPVAPVQNAEEIELDL
jgi:hypothetical protein